MKIIHRGPVYTIGIEPGESGQMEAVKTGPDGLLRREPYYPERDVAPLAGIMDEPGVWKLIAGTASDLLAGCDTPVCPSHILVADDGRFFLNPWSRSLDSACCAPEGYDPVWALGATVFFMAMGCPVFYGYGGGFQRERTPVPMMRRAWPELSALVAKCLAFKPSSRVSVKEISEAAARALKRLEAKGLSPRPLTPDAALVAKASDVNAIDRLWPEKF